MQQLKMKRVVPVKWSMAALIAIASAVLLADTALQAQHENGAGKIVQAAASPDAAPQVTISNYAFSPVPLTVKVGTTVTWINRDDDPHSVDSTAGKFKSKALDTGSTFEFHFTEAGEYPFNCRFHPKMTGKIIVQP
ncbi:MAG TPA: cupredoxin family copper-binding protein [Candidatus Solibacter sp.]|nr:cupredoxin family copper-binding protein [Candidatus Solibacter sp.]